MIEKFKSNAEAIATADKYLYGNHARMPIVMDRGEGCWVWDLDNNKYLDFAGPRQGHDALLQLLLQ